MENFIWLIIIIFAIGILFYFLKDRIYIFLHQEKQYLYKKKEFLLNIPERKFFKELQNIIPDNYVVFPQVLLSSIVSVDSPRKEFWKYQNKINRKTIDFVIFEKPFFKPVLAVEYDGKTHDYPNRKERDIEVSKILEKSGIKNFHIIHQENIDFEELKNRIVSILTTINY